MIELLVVIAIIGILASLLSSAIAKSKGRARGIVCAGNHRQLILAWTMYAHDNNDRLVYNYGGDAARRTLSTNMAYNWVPNVMSWELDSDNTNTARVANSRLGVQAARNSQIFRCPADRVVSEVQRAAGWKQRARSYSMNAMVGHAGELMYGRTNLNNPEFVQFLRLSDFAVPAAIFVFLDEHPDSINDGYFLNKPEDAEWVDLPGSYHNGACTFAFADGHVETHRWQDHTTRFPARPNAVPLPFTIPDERQADFRWLAARMSPRR